MPLMAVRVSEAKCGEAHNCRVCCGLGVIGQNGKCFCATAPGEGRSANLGRCGSDEVCYPVMTNNEGLRCVEGSCNWFESACRLKSTRQFKFIVLIVTHPRFCYCTSLNFHCVLGFC